MTDTAKLKDDLHQLIDQIEDQTILKALRILLSPKADILHNAQGQPLDHNQIEDLLEESEKDIEAGRTVFNQELKSHIQSWRNQNSAK